MYSSRVSVFLKIVLVLPVQQEFATLAATCVCCHSALVEATGANSPNGAMEVDPEVALQYWLTTCCGVWSVLAWESAGW
jgi:hypothetical protein